MPANYTLHNSIDLVKAIKLRYDNLVGIYHDEPEQGPKYELPIRPNIRWPRMVFRKTCDMTHPYHGLYTPVKLGAWTNDELLSEAAGVNWIDKVINLYDPYNTPSIPDENIAKGKTGIGAFWQSGLESAISFDDWYEIIGGIVDSLNFTYKPTHYHTAYKYLPEIILGSLKYVVTNRTTNLNIVGAEVEARGDYKSTKEEAIASVLNDPAYYERFPAEGMDGEHGRSGSRTGFSTSGTYVRAYFKKSIIHIPIMDRPVADFSTEAYYLMQAYARAGGYETFNDENVPDAAGAAIIVSPNANGVVVIGSLDDPTAGQFPAGTGSSIGWGFVDDDPSYLSSAYAINLDQED